MMENELQTATTIFWDLKSSEEINGDIYASNTVLLHVSFSCSTIFYFLLNRNVRLYFYVSCLSEECFTHILLSLVAHVAQSDQ